MAGVIRREEFRAPSPFSFADLEGQAQAVLQEARARAERIVRQAEARAAQRAEQLAQQARLRGLEEGRREGLRQIRAAAEKTVLQETRQRLEQLAGALSAGLAEFDASKRRLLGQAEAGLIELALAIARRVCKLLVARCPEAAQANARSLLAAVQQAGDLELHVNPAEYDALRAACAELVETCRGLGHVELLADPGVGRGGCLLRTRAGQIDASIETQLERIAAALLGAPPAGADEPRAGTGP